MAVLSVVVFHLNADWLPGGFAGVDIFFVISGYLITGIVWSELAAGRFTLKTFYQRRILRIVPAYYLVLAASFLVGAVVLMPVEFDAFSMSARASVLLQPTSGSSAGSTISTRPPSRITCCISGRWRSRNSSTSCSRWF